MAEYISRVVTLPLEVNRAVECTHSLTRMEGRTGRGSPLNLRETARPLQLLVQQV